MDALDLYKQTADLLDVTLDYSDDEEGHFVEIPIGEERTQIVWLYTDTNQLEIGEDPMEIVYADSVVGSITDDVDPYGLLEYAGGLILSRIYLIEGDEGEDSIVLQGSMPLEMCTAEILAAMVLEIAAHADDLEASLFGEDDE